MSYKRNLGTTCLNGFAAILMMGRMLAYAKLLTVPEFGTLSIGLLISASLAMVNAFGLYLLMQRDLPYLFAARRVTRGMIMMCEVTLVTVLCAVPLLGLSVTGMSLAGGAGALLALAAVHGLTNQLFGIVSTESKSRLLQTEFSVTLFSRSCVVSVAGLLTAVKIGSAEAILAAEILATAVMIGIVTMRAGAPVIDNALLGSALSENLRRFDKGGDAFYDQISALHKSVRGSDPDATLYWFCRMIDGGADPRYLARRIVRMAWEDIGLADPRAARITLDAAAR